MRFWSRELAGWLLIVIGLFIFRQCYLLLTHTDHYLLEGGALTVVGVIIFRGGIHLLKIAVAAQVCMEANERLEHPSPSARPVASASSRRQPVSGRAL